MQLREATREDLDHILELERQTFPETAFSRATFLYYMDSASSRVRLLIAGDEPVGYVVYTVRGHPPLVYVDSIAVEPEHRGQGYGRRMMEHVSTVASESGIRYVKLHVRESNSRARDFYRALGFERAGTVESYYRDGEDACVMRLVVRG